VTTPTLSSPGSPSLTSEQTAVTQYESTSEKSVRLSTTSPLKALACDGTSPLSSLTPALSLTPLRSLWLYTCFTVSPKSSHSGLRIATTTSARATYGRSTLLSPLSRITYVMAMRSHSKPSPLLQNSRRRSACSNALINTKIRLDFRIYATAARLLYALRQGTCRWHGQLLESSPTSDASLSESTRASRNSTSYTLNSKRHCCYPLSCKLRLQQLRLRLNCYFCITKSPLKGGKRQAIQAALLLRHCC
jgi:hypothetical protein